MGNQPRILERVVTILERLLIYLVYLTFNSFLAVFFMAGNQFSLPLLVSFAMPSTLCFIYLQIKLNKTDKELKGGE